MNKEKYDDLLDQILYYFNPCKTEQLISALMKCYSEIETVRQARIILFKYQGRGRVLLSDDGYAITKGKYEQITEDTKGSKVDFYSQNRITRLENIVQNTCDTKLIDCLWILLDFMPASLDFSLSSKPFNLIFLSKNRLYQVIKINANEIDRKVEMLKNIPYCDFQLPVPNLDDEDKQKEIEQMYKDMKKNFVRIAILENEKHAWKIPEGLGFRFICTIDDTQNTHYKIVEQRKKIW